MRVITQIVHAKKKRSQASTSACPSSTVSSSTMIREHPRFQKTAIIFVSAIQMTDLDLLRGYQLGAVDYVPVPVIPELLRAKVKVFAELYRKTRQLELLNAELEVRVA